MTETFSSPSFHLIKALFARDAEAARASFGPDVVLDAPFAGRITGERALRWATRLWPALFGADDRVSVRPRHETIADGRAMVEILVPILCNGAPAQLPVAIQGELDGSGLLREARVYFCEKPVTGLLRQRASAFPHAGDPKIATPDDFPDVNGPYIANQIAWNIDGIMAQFGDDPYLERGTDRLEGVAAVRSLYDLVIIPGRPVRLVKDTGTYDGKTFVLEWSSSRLPVISGISSYERDGNGRIKGIRMYDNSPWPCD